VQDTRYRKTLGKDAFTEWQTLDKKTLDKGPSTAVIKLTVVSLCRGPKVDTRQRSFFVESQISGTRQSPLTECLLWTLDKTYFYFFNFGNQTFCGMFLHYVDLHVPFWDNYNKVFKLVDLVRLFEFLRKIQI
jgi:hypothetical protein